MSGDDSLCVRCARHTETCCQNTDIYITQGDVERIARHTGRSDFHEHRSASDLVYLEDDNDPIWHEHIWRADGTRRVLKQQANGDCCFLDRQGCTLPAQVRPLICRLYPFSYTEAGIEEKLARGCPVELLRPGETLLESLQMKIDAARVWHRQLYAEIRAEGRQSESGEAVRSWRFDEVKKGDRVHGHSWGRDSRRERNGMQLGLTYDLRSDYLAAGYGEEETAEFDSLETIDALEGALTALGHQVERIGNARQLIERLAQGQRWDGIFNICEGLRGLAREAQVPAILDLYEIPYTFSDPLVMSLSLHKGYTKTILQNAGIPTPAYRVLHAPSDLQTMAALPFPVFAKPVGEGTGKGVTPMSLVRHERQLKEVVESLLHRYQQPVLLEEYLPGREFTVGLVGSADEAEVLGTLEIVLRDGAEADVYSFVNKERCEELVEYRLVRAEDDAEVAEAEQIALAAWRSLDCRDGGRVDLRSNAQGNPQFLEVNPLAGLHPTHSDLPMLATAVGIDYVTLISRILESATKRWSRHADRRPAPSNV